MNANIELKFQLQQAVKQVLECVLAAVFLVLLAPLLALLALAVRLDSPGEMIFGHRRIGKDGKPFILYKFRSMVKGGDDSGYMQYLQALIESERGESSQGLPYRKMEADARVTRVGNWLRRYYLDELPQLFNILRGEMSWVGPRPHVQFEVDQYTDEQRRRLSVRPGLTGLWQVEGKADCTFSELIQLDLDYIDRWSLLLDAKIIVQTILVMLRGGEESWTRNTKPAPANKPLTSATNRDQDLSGQTEAGTTLTQNWLIEIPHRTKEYADENG